MKFSTFETNTPATTLRNRNLRPEAERKSAGFYVYTTLPKVLFSPWIIQESFSNHSRLLEWFFHTILIWYHVNNLWLFRVVCRIILVTMAPGPPRVWASQPSPNLPLCMLTWEGMVVRFEPPWPFIGEIISSNKISSTCNWFWAALSTHALIFKLYYFKLKFLMLV